MFIETDGVDLLSLIFAADWVVKSVMLILLIASILSWAILLFKWLELSRAEKNSRAFIDEFLELGHLPVLLKKPANEIDSPACHLLSAAIDEWQVSTRGGTAQRRPLTERIRLAVSSALRDDIKILERYLPVLASIGSTSPFIGLFGTVWGIMNSFRAIALTGQSDLSVVAPGIAEALFATALGLAAAIPATIFYNYFTTRINDFSVEMEIFADRIDRDLSRRFDKMQTKKS